MKVYPTYHTELPCYRFQRRADFLVLAAKGEKIVTKTFVVRWLPWAENIPQDKPCKPAAAEGIAVGFTATKKGISKKAVLRNTAKRRLRAVFDDQLRLKAQQKLCNTPVQMILIARPALLDYPWEDLQKDMAYVVRRIGKEMPKSASLDKPINLPM